MVFIIPAVLSTKQCHDYVGGSRLWEELIAAHGDILRPVRTVPRGDSFYRRETVDRALILAEATGSLLAPVTAASPPILKRQARRFKPQG
jgi:hypothetical protein